ncbi:hypothetical protein, partial [Marinobacter sp.]|uniref:hypothetical protein n=1 Tax=Marinobacter sp. TaxID=50741 RepID=UPI003A929D51
PADYRLRNYEGFIKGVESELKRQLSERFVEQTEAQFGASITPELGTEAFLAHPVIQGPLKEALGVKSRSEPVALNLSERAFRDNILIPAIEETLAIERARLMAKTAYFGDGEPYEPDGKLYVRSVLIPPVAMGLSLFFGLLNLVSLVAISFTRLGLNHRFVGIIRPLLLAIIIVAPLVFSSQIAQTTPFKRIVDETQESLGLGRYFVIWVTSLQPMVYPVGDALADTFGVFGFERVEQP